EAGVGAGAERRAGLAGGAVPVHTVLFEAVVGREVEAAAEPPDRRRALRARDEEAHVHVRGRHVGVARVHDQRDRDRLVGAARELRAALGGGGGQRLAARVREVDGGLLDHLAVLEHTRARERAARRLEALLAEARRAVLALERGADAGLGIGAVAAARRRIRPGRGAARRPGAHAPPAARSSSPPSAPGSASPAPPPAGAAPARPSKANASRPSGPSDTRATPPRASGPNSTASAIGSLSSRWITRAIGRAPKSGS